MCGRFAFFELLRFLDELRETGFPYERNEHYHFMPGYNIAPESTITVLLGDEGTNLLSNAHWGLIPHWADSMPKVRPINARAESLGMKPYFRHMLNRRHCLIPASGFYEWSAERNGSDKCSAERNASDKWREQRNASAKHPWFIHRSDGRPMALAGLWDIWQPPDPEKPPLTSCTIITTAANPQMRAIHDRMPVILEPETWKPWLEPEKDASVELLKPAAEGILELHRVSRKINNPQYIRKDCIEPLADE
ncbi:MAG: SOS response-associated peptidase [Chlorobium sp.]|uniref:SOS response-associated peptidase n=1 Tax=Chlorobium sp. TaxID=1095 RepID=UPI0025C67929|nr:SOS response-associated peptidase [Chlorobium sp.]MCF8382870.1 SOS response-associated peptidase [Chlorobium sp.]